MGRIGNGYLHSGQNQPIPNVYLHHRELVLLIQINHVQAAQLSAPILIVICRVLFVVNV